MPATPQNIAPVVLADGIAGTLMVSVGAFHNGDFQTLPTAGGALLTAGVAQVLDPEGFANRQRQTSADNISHVGVASGTQQLLSPISTTLNGATVAGATSATLAATKFTNRGAAAWIQVGSELVFEPGTTNQETVVVTAINYGTNVVTIQGLGNGGSNTGFKFAHANAVAVTTGALNQARDATMPDGSLGLGVAAGATYLLNTTLNGGAGGWEGERSAAGELDGATGAGTAIAGEYEWNGDPLAFGSVLSSDQFDRARNVNAKGLGAGTISNNPLAANSLTLTLSAAPTTLHPGQKILIDRAGANPETNYVGTGYLPGATSVPLQIATQFSHALNATVEWDQHAALGPGLNGFLPDGIGIEEEALWDPVSQKFYIERAATQDAMPAANIVAEAPALWNGATMDRARSLQGVSGTAGLGVEACAIVPTASANQGIAPLVSTALESGHVFKAAAGNLYALSVTNYDQATRTLLIFDATAVPADGAVTPKYAYPVPAATALAAGYLSLAWTVPAAMAAGICASISTNNTTPFTKAAGTSAMFSAQVV